MIITLKENVKEEVDALLHELGVQDLVDDPVDLSLVLDPRLHPWKSSTRMKKISREMISLVITTVSKYQTSQLVQMTVI